MYPYEGKYFFCSFFLYKVVCMIAVTDLVILDTKLAQLSDNRDYGVMMDCSPKNATSIEALSRPAKRTNVCTGYTIASRIICITELTCIVRSQAGSSSSLLY